MDRINKLTQVALRHSIFLVHYSIFQIANRNLPHLLIVFLLCPLIFSCKTKLKTRALDPGEIIRLSESETSARQNCEAKGAHAPHPTAVPEEPIRYIRVNFHFMNSTDSSSNYSYKTGTHFARDIVKYANQDLAKNQPMNLPLRNSTPVLPTNYRYVLTPDGSVEGDEGIYFHYDDALCYFIHQGKNRNSVSKEVIKKYCINPDSVLNVFVMPHHPDSVASKTYSEGQTGIALGNSIKISGIVEKKKYQPWLFRGLLNHEIAHVLGLHHSWGKRDGCDDTPPNPNCWHRTKNGSSCDSLNSNNVMDYNLNQNSWTPCQLSKIHRNFSQIGSRQRKLLIPHWCRLDTSQNVTIRDTVHWTTAKDLSGHLTIADGAQLTVSCRVALPENARIEVMPRGKLILDNSWLHNDCGEKVARHPGSRTRQKRSRPGCFSGGSEGSGYRRRVVMRNHSCSRQI